MNVKDLVSKFYYDASRPVVFIINDKSYTYYEVVDNNVLLNTIINKIEIQGKVYELTSDDIIQYNSHVIHDFVIPDNAHYFLIKVIIKWKEE